MSDHYHVEPTYGYFELIDEDGKVIREPGRFGEMVGTGFHNPGMSFIRYRTGDYAEYVGDCCPACGRKLTLLKNIRGRWNGDKLYNPDGTFVTTTALNLHSDLYSVIEGIQYIQEKKGEIKILIIKSPMYNENHEKKFYEHFRVKFKLGMVIKIEYVSKLRKLKNGKFMHIISSIKE
jgi:phenylacetate-CoA ligase